MARSWVLGWNVVARQEASPVSVPPPSVGRAQRGVLWDFPPSPTHPPTHSLPPAEPPVASPLSSPVASPLLSPVSSFVASPVASPAEPLLAPPAPQTAPWRLRGCLKWTRPELRQADLWDLSSGSEPPLERLSHLDSAPLSALWQLDPLAALAISSGCESVEPVDPCAAEADPALVLAIWEVGRCHLSLKQTTSPLGRQGLPLERALPELA